jgi:hypothetical protein
MEYLLEGQVRPSDFSPVPKKGSFEILREAVARCKKVRFIAPYLIIIL